LSRPLVLVIDDEPQVRRFLRASFKANGLRTIESATAEDGIAVAEQNVPDVVILDLGLPDIDGIEVARRLRSWSQVPILVLSARGQEAQKVAALDAGADDYLTKPFGIKELLARIRVALRHAGRARTTMPEGSSSIGPLRVDFESRRVFVSEREVSLTPIEYKLLGLLVRNAGRVVTHRQLLESIWGPNAIERTHYLRVHMTHLRRKLEVDPMSPRFIRTEAGVGYRLSNEQP
jgi:two-component system, OmpR family, KDP operon response regulator KdpE